MAIWKNKRFEAWQKQNPDKSFAAFYAETSAKKRREGLPHANLGANLTTGEFALSGVQFFDKIVELGLKPEHTLADYGCGTLRIGVHAMNYLEPGCYWGLDVSDDFLEQGRELVGGALLEEKKPHLCVISPRSVAQAAAAAPHMVISTKVFNHVHPDELAEYFHNIMQIAGSSGRAVITGKWSEGKTVQHKARGWSHSLETMHHLVNCEGGSLSIIEQENKEKWGPDVRIGIFSLRRAG
jgi:hypothetical protein